MAFRKRRKASVSWLPVLGQNTGSTDSWLEDAINVQNTVGAAGISTNIHALTVDYPAEAVQSVQVESLSDYQGSGYRLRRIVGKFYCGMDPDIGDAQTTYPQGALVAAGLIVLRVDTATGAPLRAATPIDYSPLGRDNVRDPWIWRRTWVLSDPFGASPVNVAIGLFGQTNMEYGSVYDGPHIDQKTARRIALEERLFLVVSTAPLRGITPTTAGRVRYVYEARYLTSPIRISGNRRNASR